MLGVVGSKSSDGNRLFRFRMTWFFRPHPVAVNKEILHKGVIWKLQAVYEMFCLFSFTKHLLSTYSEVNWFNII